MKKILLLFLLIPVAAFAEPQVLPNLSSQPNYLTPQVVAGVNPNGEAIPLHLDMMGNLALACNSGGGGNGNVSGPSNSMDNTLVRFDGSDGQHIQSSGVTLNDVNDFFGIHNLIVNGDLGFWDSGAIQSSLSYSTANNPHSTILTAPASGIIHIANEADKNFNWFGSFIPPTSGSAILVFHSRNQVRNEFGAMGFVDDVDTKRFGFILGEGDDLDGVAKSEPGVKFQVKAGAGGTLLPGGKGGDIDLETGSAGAGNNNGGDLIIRFGNGSGTGRQGVVRSEWGDIRFKNNFGGAFRIEEAGGSQSLTLNHDGFNGIITSTFGKVKVPSGIITTSISADSPGSVDYRNVNMLELTQADLTPGNCSVGQMRLDTGGATTELCYCRSVNSWVCTAMMPGPVD